VRMSVALMDTGGYAAQLIEDDVTIQLRLGQFVLDRYQALYLGIFRRIRSMLNLHQSRLIHESREVVYGLVGCVVLVEGIGDNVGQSEILVHRGQYIKFSASRLDAMKATVLSGQ